MLHVICKLFSNFGTRKITSVCSSTPRMSTSKCQCPPSSAILMNGAVSPLHRTFSLRGASLRTEYVFMAMRS